MSTKSISSPSLPTLSGLFSTTPSTPSYSRCTASFDVTSLFHELRIRIAQKEDLISSVESGTSSATDSTTKTSDESAKRSRSLSQGGASSSSTSVPSNTKDEGLLGKLMLPSLSLIFPRRRSSSTTTKSEVISTLDARAKEILFSLRDLHSNLLKLRTSYINPFRHFSHYAAPMTDQERDELDANVKQNLTDLTETLERFRWDIEREFPSSDASSSSSSSSFPEASLGIHFKGVLNILQHRLDLISRLFQDQRSLRLKQLMEAKEGGYFTKKSKQALSRSTVSTPSLSTISTSSLLSDPIPELESISGDNETTKQRKTSSPSLSTPSSSSSSATSSPSSSTPTTLPTPSLASFTKKVFGVEDSRNKKNTEGIEGGGRGREEKDLTEEELRELEQENKSLLRDFDQMVDQTRQIERQVVEIADLQREFGQKVVEQESVFDIVVNSAMNANQMLNRGANELEKAAKNGVDFRFIMLVILIVASFSLLFLDWFE